MGKLLLGKSVLEASKEWRQIVKTLLKNDWYCQNLGFGVTKSSAYEKYLNLMRRRREKWGIFSEQ